MHIYKQYFTLMDKCIHSKVAVKYACGFNCDCFCFFDVQCCWPFQLSAGWFLKLCDKMTPKSSAVNCLFGPMVSNESVRISSVGVSLFGCRSSTVGFGANSVRVCLWPMVCNEWSDGKKCQSLWPMAYNEWSDGEVCQSLSLANGKQWMVWLWRVSESVFSQWCAMNGLMVKSVRVCLWQMAYSKWSDVEECQNLSLANGVQWMVW